MMMNEKIINLIMKALTNIKTDFIIDGYSDCGRKREDIEIYFKLNPTFERAIIIGMYEVDIITKILDDELPHNHMKWELLVISYDNKHQRIELRFGLMGVIDDGKESRASDIS